MSEPAPARAALVDPARLEQYLAGVVALREDLPLEAVEGVGQGQSNVTFRVRLAGRTLILRRPPPGPLPPKAHDVLREHRVMHALCQTNAPIPKMISACADSDVLGAPFYLMEALAGDAIRFDLPPSLGVVLRLLGAPSWVRIGGRPGHAPFDRPGDGRTR